MAIHRTQLLLVFLIWNKDLAVRNAAALTSAPHVPKTAVDPFSLDEVKTFLKAVEDEPLEAAFVVAATAGLRRGEVLGLVGPTLTLSGASSRFVALFSASGGSYRSSRPSPGSLAS